MQIQMQGDQQGEPQGDCVQYRFLIPEAAANAILSRKGEVIRRLRSEFQCEITVPPNNGPERLLIVTGDISQVNSVLAAVIDLALEHMHSRVNDPREITGGVLPEMGAPPSEEVDLRFLVSENVCGAIIGKGGEVIRRLTEGHRVSAIKVYQQLCPGSSDRVIRLVGRPPEVLGCLADIHQVIAGLRDRRSARLYDPEDHNEAHAVNYGGWVSLEGRRALARQGGPPPGTRGPTPSGREVGGGGLGVAMGMGTPGVPMGMGPPGMVPMGGPGPMLGGPPRPPMGPVSAGGPPMRGGMAGLTLGRMADRLRADSILAEAALANQAQAQMMAPVLPSQGMMPVPPGGPLETAHVSLANRLVGAIMGRGGIRINEIREQSGARIDVEKTPLSAEGDERVITIVGSRAQIQAAQYLLQQCVHKYGSGGRNY